MIKISRFQLKSLAAIFFAVVLLARPALSQDRPDAVLSNEFGPVTCGHFLGMLDSYLSELSNNPTSQGYVIFYQGGVSPLSVVSRERQLRSHLKMRRFDESRIAIIGGPAQMKVHTQLWTIPIGAENPEVKPADPLALADLTKPDSYMFSTSVTEGDSCGQWPLDLPAFADELKKGPDYGGQIVIRETSAAKFRRTEKELLSKLTKAGIPPTRLKTSFEKSQVGEYSKSVELWVTWSKTPSAKQGN